MNSKPFIGITADFRSAQGDKPAFSYLASGYYDAIAEVGGIPLLIPPLEENDDLNAVLDRLDGVLLVGGADLDPRRDGFMTHPSVRPLAERRENFDRRLIKLIAKRRVPVMGIGLGMQLLNVSQGGNLFLHIPEDMPKALPHTDSIDKEVHRHTLEVVPGTIMERVYGDGEIRVNSMHHMAVDQVAEGFTISARCPDGVIEAIESTMSDWFAFGTQFHPEAETASALDVRIFEEFIDGVKSAEPVAARVRLVA
jgi:putative glutamine amidotransferase